jgi:VanZ family protein
MRNFGRAWDLYLATIVFLGGVGFYYYLRPPTMVGIWLDIHGYRINHSFIAYFNWFPSFAHVFFFTILTWYVLERSHEILSLVLWVGLNILYEYGQSYFIRGTYANEDVIAIFLGGIIAFIVMKIKKNSLLDKE